MKADNKNIKLDNALMIVAIIAVGFAFVNLMTTIDKFRDIQSLTGYATDTGVANLTILSTASINFTTFQIQWGEGYINTTATIANLSTDGLNSGQGWNNVTDALILENIGNVNVSINLSSDKAAATFIGGNSPTFEWKVSSNETNACKDPTNITAYTTVTTAEQLACTNFGWADTTDKLEIDIAVGIGSGAAGEKTATITAEATAIA